MSRLLPIAAVALSLALGLWLRGGALHAGFWSDDYLHQAMLAERYPAPRAPFDLFSFARGGAEDTGALVAYGYYPWWTHPEFRLNMLRPGASLLHALDYQAFGPDARVHHLHSLLWWALSVIAAAALLFSVLPRAAAASAVVLFALDESHTLPLVWISNRSSLIATALGAAAIFLHVRFRRTHSGAARAGSIALVALALLAGEYALAMLGYLVCFEWMRRPSAGPSRLRALLPASGLALAFVVAWVALGYGTAHSGLYTNPLQDPLAFAQKLAAGVPVLLAELVLGVPADFFSFGSPWPALLRTAGRFEDSTWQALPSWRAVQIALGICSVPLVLFALRWLERRVEPAHARALRWLLAGAVLGLLPVLGSFVTTRLALPASMGFAALWGSLLAQAGTTLRGASTAGWLRAAFAALVSATVLYVHALRPAITGAEAVAFYADAAVARTQWPLHAAIDDARVGTQQIVMINSADANDAPYLPFVRFAHGHPLPRGFRLLSASPAAHRFTRIDERTFELNVVGQRGLERSVVGSLTRDASEEIRAGQRFSVPGMQVDVLATHAGQPVHMRYRFDTALEHPGLLWLASTEVGLRPLRLPQPGAVVWIEPPALPATAAVGAERD